MLRYLSNYLCALAILAAGSVARGQAAPQPAAARDLDAQVATIGHRLAVSNLAWCRDRERLPGLTLGVENPASASHTGGQTLRATILALAQSAPAARAGVLPNDVVESVDDQPLPAATLGPDGGIGGMERVRTAFEGAFADGSARLGLRRAGAVVTLDVDADPGCASRFLILPSRQLNAFANGRSVQVTSRLAEETRQEDELAAVLAHEFAHHVLRHRALLDAAGVSRGVMRNFGRNARLIRATEEAADQLSVWLLAQAGYDPEAAVRFWSWFGRSGFNFFGSPTHGGWQGRVARLRAEIAAMRAAGPDGRPVFLPPAD